ncbi:response regulator transcription factor [Hoyosella sp. G463]|uniref:Response regulator transcription factor n=1 Tax=Lolliginicoccus lacisalsi TaxID=2742202 RepID=A0A927JCE3_9ACTN|nr:response regulator transcription factor [Lolliginicoccus lacisalsi]MBD8506590.1 response regulator transcription factor [Lolliginicoccus lacisalsi]
MVEQPIKVALVDDQQLVRAGFRMVIDSQPDMHVVLEASDGQQGLREIDRVGCDIVLMDVQMPTMNGIDATRAITSHSAGAPRVVVLTTFDNDEYVLGAISAGASGFLLKDADPEQLLDAIRTVHRGDAVIAPRATRNLLRPLGPLIAPGSTRAETSARALPSELTPREVEVLAAMARGLTNGEIAEQFFVSEATVKTHVGRILAKTQSRDRVQAVILAYQAGLVDPDDVLRGD